MHYFPLKYAQQAMPGRESGGRKEEGGTALPSLLSLLWLGLLLLLLQAQAAAAEEAAAEAAATKLHWQDMPNMLLSPLSSLIKCCLIEIV